MKRIALSLLLFLPLQGFAEEDLNKMFSKVNEFVAAENFPKAMEELGWIKKELEKRNNNKLSTFLPDQVEGFAGAKLEVSGAMGFSNIERRYTKGSDNFTVSVTGGSGAGGMMGGLAGFGRMAAMMGAQNPNQDTFRVDGLTAMVENSGSQKSMQIFLNSGSIFKLEMNGDKETSELRKVAEAFKLGDLDNYLQGKG